MSVVGSMYRARGRQGRHSHRNGANDASEAILPSGFKAAAPRSGGRRHLGLVRSEVTRSQSTSLTHTIKDHSFRDPSGLDSLFKEADIWPAESDGSLSEHVNFCGLPRPKSSTRHRSEQAPTEGTSSAFRQPSLDPLVTIDALKCRTDAPKLSKDIRKFRTTADNITDSQGFTAQRKSCWTRGTEAKEMITPKWNNSGPNVQNNDPPRPPLSLNKIRKRVARRSPLVNDSTATTSSFNEGAFAENMTKPSPAPVVNPKERQRTNSKFPSLLSTHCEISSLKSFPSTKLSRSTPGIDQARNKEVVDDFEATSPADKSLATETRFDGERDACNKTMDTCTIASDATVAPHLRRKPDVLKAPKNLVAGVSTSPYRRRSTETVDISSPTTARSFARSLPSHLHVAWIKSTLQNAEKEIASETAFEPRRFVPALSSNSQTRCPVPAMAKHDIAVEKVPQQDNVIESNKTSLILCPARPEKGIDDLPQDLQRMIAAHPLERIKSDDTQSSKALVHRKKAEIIEKHAQESLTVTAEPLNGKPRKGFEDKRELNVTNAVPTFAPEPTQTIAPKTKNASSGKGYGPSPQVSATVKARKSKETLNIDETGPFPWISRYTSLQGWDHQMTPAPIGEEWAMREPHNFTDAKHKAIIETWASDQLEDQVGKILNIDIHDPEFLNGQGIIDDDIGLQKGIEASLHDATPDRTTMHEPKRQLTSEEIIKEHITRRGLPSSEHRTKKQEKRHSLSGETKAERRARLELARAFERSIDFETNEHTPKANIYMRPAESKDIPLITDLHNEFIANSTATHFVKASDESMWRNILASCRADCCPFFVAILSQSQARAMQAKDVRRGKFESVVGFAYAVDFAAPDNAYRITLEFEIWVDPRHQHKGIGKTLLDRMLACLDPMYPWKDPAPFLDMGNSRKWMGGGHRIVQTLIVTMLYSNAEKDEFEWKKGWLERSGFKIGGMIPNMGRKSRKQIHFCQMYYTTGADVSHIFQ